MWSTLASHMNPPEKLLLPFVPRPLSYVQSQLTGSRNLLSTKDIRMIPRTQMRSQLLPASVVQETTDLLKIAQQQRALAITLVIEVIGLGHRSALTKPSRC